MAQNDYLEDQQRLQVSFINTAIGLSRRGNLDQNITLKYVSIFDSGYVGFRNQNGPGIRSVSQAELYEYMVNEVRKIITVYETTDVPFEREVAKQMLLLINHLKTQIRFNLNNNLNLRLNQFAGISPFDNLPVFNDGSLFSN